MKTLYIECNMGAAGDMLLAALLELHDNPKEFLEKLNNIGLSGVLVSAEPSVNSGITGTRIRIAVNGQEEDTHSDHQHGEHKHQHDHTHEHTHSHTHNNHAHNEHHHKSYHDIEHLIGHLNVSDWVKNNVLSVYKRIAEAESHVHGVTVDKIHFHEVGNMDAVADITGVCMLIEDLSPDLILASAVNTGSGQVRCAHGILPVPAPATAHILHNVPIYHDDINGELCTPTGAAILKHFVKEFCTMPVLTVSKIGYGMGGKVFPKANCLRAFIGNMASAGEKIFELVCNMDDMTPEATAFAQQLLLDEGALDVWTTPVGMKKGRPGLLFTCICRNDDKDKMLSLIFKHTTTLGVRENVCRRYTLQREQAEVKTKYGAVRIKKSYGFGAEKSKAEYEDLAKIAREKGISIQDVLDAIKQVGE